MPRLLPDAESLPPRPGNALADALAGHALPQSRLRTRVQPAPRPQRAFVRGEVLVGADRGGRTLRRRLHVRPVQPCPCRALRTRHRMAVVRRRDVAEAHGPLTDRAARYLVPPGGPRR